MILPVGLRPPGGPGGQKSENKKKIRKSAQNCTQCKHIAIAGGIKRNTTGLQEAPGVKIRKNSAGNGVRHGNALTIFIFT